MDSEDANSSYSDSPQPYQHPYDRAEAIWNQLQRYRTVFYSYWWIVLLAIGIGLGVKGWSVFSSPAFYRSDGRIIVSGRISLPDASMYTEEAVNFFGTQMELMQSAEVREKANQRVQAFRPELIPVPVNLSVAQVPKTSIFVLQASGTSPEYVKAYLNALMEAYIDLRRGIFSEKSQTTLTAVTDELMKVETNLRQAEDKLLNWQKQNNLLLLKQEDSNAGGYLAILNRKLADNETEYNLLDRLSVDQNADRMRQEQKQGNPATPAGPKGDEDTLASAGLANGIVPQDYVTARQQLLIEQAQLDQFLINHKPDHPRVKELERAIDERRRLLEILRKQAVEQIQSQKSALGVQIENGKEQIKLWEQRARELGGRMGEFDQLQAAVDRQKSLYERLLSNVQNINVNNGIQQDIVSIMEYASSPSFIVVNVVRPMAMGALLGLLAGCGILLLIAIFDDRFMSLSELQAIFVEEEVMGLVPKMPEGQALIYGPGQEETVLTEAFRNIRSWLSLAPWEGGRPKVIVITSAIPGEGKSTVAANLALILAASGSKVLLVDADIRRGIQHELFEVDSAPGLGNIVSGEIEWSQTVRTLEVEHLHLVPKGEFFGRQTEKYISTTFENFLKQITPKFDYIVIDTSPILSVDETTTIAAQADTVLMVTRFSYTGVRMARKATALLKARIGKIHGVIYNAMELSALDNPYYRYFYQPLTKADKNS